jgi:hypothetical protein
VSPRRFKRRTYIIVASGRSALTFSAATSASLAWTTIRSALPFTLSPTVNCRTGRKFRTSDRHLFERPSGRAARDRHRRYHGVTGTDRAFSFMRFLYRGLPLPLVFLWLSAHLSSPIKEIGEIAMADRPITHMDEGSKGGRNSVLLFGLVASILTVLLILVGVGGKNVAPNLAQSSTESPATSGSLNP